MPRQEFWERKMFRWKLALTFVLTMQLASSRAQLYRNSSEPVLVDTMVRASSTSMPLKPTRLPFPCVHAPANHPIYVGQRTLHSSLHPRPPHSWWRLNRLHTHRLRTLCRSRYDRRSSGTSTLPKFPSPLYHSASLLTETIVRTRRSSHPQ